MQSGLESLVLRNNRRAAHLEYLICPNISAKGKKQNKEKRKRRVRSDRTKREKKYVRKKERKKRKANGKQNSNMTINVTLRRVSVTTVAM
jgi:hypothetical protein